MTATPYNATGEYQPESVIELPALYSWPPRPIAALKWLFFGMLFPWGYLYIGLSFLVWYFLMPSMAAMASFEFGWIAGIWLRNAAILTLVAGGLHWWFYMIRGQGSQYKYHDKWLEADSDKVNSEIFNVGSAKNVYQIGPLAEIVAARVAAALMVGDSEAFPSASPSIAFASPKSSTFTVPSS